MRVRVCDLKSMKLTPFIHSVLLLMIFHKKKHKIGETMKLGESISKVS